MVIRQAHELFRVSLISEYFFMYYQYFDKVMEFTNLYKGLKRACRNVRWKDSVVGYEYNAIPNTLSLIDDLKSGKYKLQGYQNFTIYEPKERHIVATRIRDRQFQSTLCACGLYDDICEHFIRDNVACQKGKGTDDALNRMKVHLRRYYNKHGKDGWVLKCDIHKYFQSIDHDIAKSAIDKYVSDERAKEEVFKIIDSFDEGIGLGSEVSQLIALSVLNEMDHIIKEKLGIKYYIRYMDDFILIHESKEHLQYCKRFLEEYLTGIKLKLNYKTILHPLKQGIMFLKWKFILTETGKVVMKMDKKKMSKQRRKIRKLLEKESRGEMPDGTAKISTEAFIANLKRGNSYKAIGSIKNYYNKKESELYGEK